MIETSCAEKRERGTKMKSIKRLAAAVLAFVMLFTAAVGMTTAAAEGAAIPGAAAKTAPTLDEALNIAGGTLHFEPYMPGEVVWPEWTVQTGSEQGHEAYAMSSTEDSTYLCLKNVELGGNETLQLDYKWFFMYNGTSNLQVEFGPAGDPYNMFALTVEALSINTTEHGMRAMLTLRKLLNLWAGNPAAMISTSTSQRTATTRAMPASTISASASVFR